MKSYSTSHTAQAPLKARPVAMTEPVSLVSLAENLLIQLGKINQLKLEHTRDAMKEYLFYHLHQFEHQAKLAGIPALKVLVARYILCATLDEAILQSNWGKHHHWCDHSLLSLFHNDTSGGERFFSLLDKALVERKFNLDIIELFYFCIALGFSGKYRIIEKGELKLIRLRQELWNLLRAEKSFSTLSIRTFEQEKPSKFSLRNKLKKIFPILFVVIVLTITYGTLEWSLYQKSAQVAELLPQTSIF